MNRISKALNLFIFNITRDYEKKCSIARKFGVNIGKNSRIITSNWGSEPYLIRIGNHCTIASNVNFITHDGMTWVFRNLGEQDKMNNYGCIVIDDNCAIGLNCIILPNVTIGPNSIVAAGSVVTKDVPPNCVVGGVPAEKICTLEEYKQKCLKNTKEELIGVKDQKEKEKVLRQIFWGSD